MSHTTDPGHLPDGIRLSLSRSIRSPDSDGAPAQPATVECRGDPIAPPGQDHSPSQTFETCHSQAPDTPTTQPSACARRPRRRLQKYAPKPKALWPTASPKRGSHDSTASGTLECGGRLATRSPGSGGLPSISIPPDLSDSKWLDYLEIDGLNSSPKSPSTSASLHSPLTAPTPTTTAPTFTELPQKTPELPDLSRLDLHRTTSSNTPGPKPMDGSMSVTPTAQRLRKSLSKRSFLAPPLKVGQLDGSAPRRKEIRVIKRRASIELIAEQYQAFLESRDPDEPEYEDLVDDWSSSGNRGAGGVDDIEEDLAKNHVTDSRDLQGDAIQLEPTRFEPYPPVPRAPSSDRPREVVLDAPIPSEPPSLSPASDGTLVAFEEDAIYFKPISFSSAPSSPQTERHSSERYSLERQSFERQSVERQSFERRSSEQQSLERRSAERQSAERPAERPAEKHTEKPLPKKPSAPSNQPLQTCIALLVRELTAAMPRQSTEHSQALQISTMIEAYERLRDQVDTTGVAEAEQPGLRSMFDCWLAALHTMHRSFARSRSGSLNDRGWHESRSRSGSVNDRIWHDPRSRSGSVNDRSWQNLPTEDVE